jgi:hypothetical protein
MVGRFKKASAPPLFLEDENFFQKIGHDGTNSAAVPRGTIVADF